MERLETHTKSQKISLLDQGKIQPQAIGIEESVLGAIILRGSLLIQIIDFITPETFYKDSHKYIYQAILNLFDKNSPIEGMTVINELKNMGMLEAVGGPYYITLICAHPEPLAIEFNARIIKEKFMAREVIRAGSELVSMAFEDTTDIFDLADKFAQEAFNLSVGTSKEASQTTKTIADDLGIQIDKIRSGAIRQDGLQSHIPSMNRILYGFKAPDVLILAGRPGSGKTALMVSLVLGLAETGHSIGIFSLEMSKKQLMYRMVSQKTGIPYQKLIDVRGLHENDFFLFKKALNEISELKIVIDDNGGITARQLKSKSKEMRLLNGVEMIFIDYLQLINGDKGSRGNREVEISEISRGIKGIAKDLDIPIMPLSQLSRKVEERTGNRPKLSDLRESGAIEQDSDAVMLCIAQLIIKSRQTQQVIIQRSK